MSDILIRVESLGVVYNKTQKTIHPMMTNGEPHLYWGMETHIDDLDMPDLFELQGELDKVDFKS